MSSTTTTTQTQQKLSVTPDIPIPRGDVEAELVFYAPPADGTTPYNYVEEPPAGEPKSNYGEFPHKLTIHDARGKESDFTLNTHGFATIQNIPDDSAVDFTSDESIEKNYYPQVEKVLLDNAKGSHRVFIFDHTVRRAGPGAKRGPVNRAHVDQTPKAAIARVHHHLGADAEKLAAGRVRLINVWRPLNGPVVATPLAYADSRTVGQDDVVAVEHRYPTRTGETAGVKYTPDAQWYYWSGMRNDERILLQCFDSHEGKRRTPHSAFVDKRTQPDWPGRESIEVRALVFG